MNSGADGLVTPGAFVWVLSNIQINGFFTTLHNTQTLLPTGITAMMNDQLLGYDIRKVLTLMALIFIGKTGI